MKKVKVILGLLALSAVLGFGSPVLAQTADNSSTEASVNSDDDDDDGDSGKWGLAGLLGLLGLLGLRRRDDDRNRNNNLNR